MGWTEVGKRTRGCSVAPCDVALSVHKPGAKGKQLRLLFRISKNITESLGWGPGTHVKTLLGTGEQANLVLVCVGGPKHRRLYSEKGNRTERFCRFAIFAQDVGLRDELHSITPAEAKIVFFDGRTALQIQIPPSWTEPVDPHLMRS